MAPYSVRSIKMGTKRKEPPPSSGNGHPSRASPRNRATKRARFADARKVDTQLQDAALEDGQLDIQAFVNARTFEIDALQSSMKKVVSSKPKRAFQTVPRHMRRRTASHNPKRVPKRLRARAMKEMAADNTPTVTQKRRPRTTRARLRAEAAKRLGILIKRKKQQRLKEAREKGENIDPSKPLVVVTRAPRPKIRRNELNEPPKSKSKFRKRQKDKTWLPTHVWHAKRATMTEPKHPKWGFALPLTPTQKSYRSTHRAVHRKGAIAWDMSYMSTIGIYGFSQAVEAVIRATCKFSDEDWERKGGSYTRGCQPAFSWICRPPEKWMAIAPITIIWNPNIDLSGHKSRRSLVSAPSKSEVFIRVHPSAFKEVWELLRHQVKSLSGLYIEDLRYEIGSIELMGGNSTEALRATFNPFWTLKRDREVDVDVYKDIDTRLGPDNYPGTPIFGFQIIDSRLRFPQRKLRSDMTVAEILERNSAIQKWQRTDRGRYALFDREARQLAVEKLLGKTAIDKRHREALPGKHPDITEDDQPIPVIVYLQRDPLRWVVLTPFKIIATIWPCLMKCPLNSGGNVQLGGLHEQQQAAFEQLIGFFPADFPSTMAGLNWELEERAKNARLWKRRPRSKRVEWKSVHLGCGRKGELGNGLACDWEFLFGVPSIEAETDFDDSKKQHNERRSWAELGQLRNSLQDMVRLTRTDLESMVRNLRQGTETMIPARAIYTVSITFFGAAKVARCARIYRLPAVPKVHSPAPSAEVVAGQVSVKATGALPANLRERWLAETPARKKSAGQDTRHKKSSKSQFQGENTTASMGERERRVAETLFATTPPAGFPSSRPGDETSNGNPVVPNGEDLIGFVTTGAFNLQLGKSSAIGSISAVKVYEGLQRDKILHEGVWCIVRNSGENVGWLAKWDIV